MSWNEHQSAKNYWCLTCFWTGWLFRMNHGDHFELLILELMQQDLKILWPRPGCSIHEPWPPFAPCRSCPTAHCAFGGSPWGVTGADGEAATCNDCFLLKPLFETAFRHDLQRSTRTFKARVQSGIQNERSESDPKPTRMLPIQE